MATITSEEEQDFVRQFYLTNQAFECSFAILGGFQNTSSPDYLEPSGGWAWVSHEPWNFTFWGSQSSINSAPEPNNGDGGCCEEYLYYNIFYEYVRYYNHPYGDGWNDGGNSGGACSLICESEMHVDHCEEFLSL